MGYIVAKNKKLKNDDILDFFNIINKEKLSGQQTTKCNTSSFLDFWQPPRILSFQFTELLLTPDAF